MAQAPLLSYVKVIDDSLVYDHAIGWWMRTKINTFEVGGGYSMQITQEIYSPLPLTEGQVFTSYIQFRNDKFSPRLDFNFWDNYICAVVYNGPNA